jgi:predicted RNA-binding protein Jag
MPEGAETEASRIAKQWFEMVTQGLGLEATVSATGTEDRVRVRVKADAAGRLIGRRGTTLAAIRHLLALALREHGEFIIDVDVDDERGDRPARDEDAPRRDDRRSEDRAPRRDDRRDDRAPRRDDRPARSDDRAPRRDDRPARPDDRGPRRDDRGPRRDDRRDDRGPERRSAFSEDKLQELGRRAAEKAVSSGKPITIKLELNSYDRRIVHLEVGEIDGVESQSVVIDGIKYIQVVPVARG